jgi:hypothetical protein
MGELLLGNVDSGASDDEIKALLVKYGFPPFDTIERVPGDGSRPVVLVSFKDASSDELRILQPRIQNLFWKNRKIRVDVMAEH